MRKKATNWKPDGYLSGEYHQRNKVDNSANEKQALAALANAEKVSMEVLPKYRSLILFLRVDIMEEWKASQILLAENDYTPWLGLRRSRELEGWCIIKRVAK